MFRVLHRVLALVVLAMTLAACAAVSSSFVPAMPPGTTTMETIDSDGISRRAMVYVPASRDVGRVAPVIVVLHGAGENGASIANLSQMNVEAERLGFVAVYPDSIRNKATGDTRWNDGRPIWGANQPPDDVRFISTLFDLLIAKYMADPNRISVAGFSNGGFMVGRLACELSDRLTAMAVIAGQRDDSACAPKHPLSVLVIHGTADTNVPYAGGADMLGFRHPAEADVVAFWRTHDGCAAAPVISQVTPAVKLQAYTACQEGNEVRFYTIRDGGHVWPNAASPSKFAASPTIAEFLLAHPLSGR